MFFANMLNFDTNIYLLMLAFNYSCSINKSLKPHFKADQSPDDSVESLVMV